MQIPRRFTGGVAALPVLFLLSWKSAIHSSIHSGRRGVLDGFDWIVASQPDRLSAINHFVCSIMPGGAWLLKNSQTAGHKQSREYPSVHPSSHFRPPLADLQEAAAAARQQQVALGNAAAVRGGGRRGMMEEVEERKKRGGRK